MRVQALDRGVRMASTVQLFSPPMPLTAVQASRWTLPGRCLMCRRNLASRIAACFQTRLLPSGVWHETRKCVPFRLGTHISPKTACSTVFRGLQQAHIRRRNLAYVGGLAPGAIVNISRPYYAGQVRRKGSLPGLALCCAVHFARQMDA